MGLRGAPSSRPMMVSSSMVGCSSPYTTILWPMFGVHAKPAVFCATKKLPAASWQIEAGRIENAQLTKLPSRSKTWMRKDSRSQTTTCCLSGWMMTE